MVIACFWDYPESLLLICGFGGLASYEATSSRFGYFCAFTGTGNHSWICIFCFGDRSGCGTEQRDGMASSAASPRGLQRHGH